MKKEDKFEICDNLLLYPVSQCREVGSQHKRERERVTGGYLCPLPNMSPVRAFLIYRSKSIAVQTPTPHLIVKAIPNPYGNRINLLCQ
jgi:hypothetical protein